MTGGSEDDSLYGDGAEGDLDGPAGSEGLVGWTLDAFHGDNWRLRIRHKSRRWRDSDGNFQMRENGVEKRAA